MVLDKTGILAEMQLKQETVTLAGGEIIVSELPAADFMDCYNNPLAMNEKGEFDGLKFTALLISRAVVDKKGERIFTDEDAATLQKKGSMTFSKIGAAVKRLNGLSGVEVKN